MEGVKQQQNDRQKEIQEERKTRQRREKETQEKDEEKDEKLKENRKMRKKEEMDSRSTQESADMVKIITQTYCMLGEVNSSWSENIKSTRTKPNKKICVIFR